MNSDFENIIDECIDRMGRGESIKACLEEYPEFAPRLKPLLQVVVRTQEAYSFLPSSAVKRQAKARFNKAREELQAKPRRTSPFFTLLSDHSKVFATAAAVVCIALVSFYGVKPMLLPSDNMIDQAPSINAPAASSGSGGTSPTTVSPVVPESIIDGNFAFLISDEVNDIGDFESLIVSISRIGIVPANESAQWIEFEPEIHDADLTILQNENAQEIWKGNIDPGEYSKVFIEVNSIVGVLNDGGPAEVKLPSGRLQMSKPFDVSSTELTSFIYDLTVVKAGSSGQYILKPQISESGVDQPFKKVMPQENPGKIPESKSEDDNHDKQKQHTELNIAIIEGESAPGEFVALLVTIDGEPVEHAIVAVDREILSTMTAADGRLTIQLPDTQAAIRIQATYQEISGELIIKPGQATK
jgi:hypothetical protein